MSQGPFDPEYVFTHHHATPKKLADYEAIHTAAKSFAQVLLDHVPECEGPPRGAEAAPGVVDARVLCRHARGAVEVVSPRNSVPASKIALEWAKRGGVEAR